MGRRRWVWNTEKFPCLPVCVCACVRVCECVCVGDNTKHKLHLNEKKEGKNALICDVIYGLSLI